MNSKKSKTTKKKSAILKPAPSIKKNEKTLMSARVLILLKDVRKCRIVMQKNKCLPTVKDCKCPLYKPPPQSNVNFIVPTHIIDSLSQESESNSDEVTNQRWLAGIEFIFGRHYYNICDRLKMNQVTDCVYDHMNICRKHSDAKPESFTEAENEEAIDFAFFAIHDDQSRYIKHIERLLADGVFPGSSKIRLMIDLMLFMYKPWTKYGSQITMEELIYRGVTAFVRLLDLYPLCIPEYKAQYKTIICDVPEMPSGLYPPIYNESMFKFLISTLKTLMDAPVDQACDAKPESFTEADSCSDDEDSVEAFNVYFYEYETREVQEIYNFEKLSRQKKMQRIFYILQLIVMLCERDLSIFILRYPRYPKASFRIEKSKPILASILWSNEKEIGNVNSLIRDIMECFVNAVYLGYPKRDIDVLSQYLNLICFCVEANELDSDVSHEVTYYPKCFWDGGILINRYVKELKCIIEDVTNINTACILEILNYMKAPIMKNMLADLMLNRYFHSLETPTAKKFYTKFFKKQWMDESNSDPTNATSRMEIDETSNFVTRYPVKTSILERTKKENQQITQTQYLAMIRISFEGYLEIYRMHELVELMKFPADSMQLRNMMQTGDFPQTNTVQQDVQGTLQKDCCAGDNLPIRSIDKKNYFFNGIVVSHKMLSFYRTEFKYCYYIGKMVEKEYEKYPAKFSDWKKLTHMLCTNEYSKSSGK